MGPARGSRLTAAHWRRATCKRSRESNSAYYGIESNKILRNKSVRRSVKLVISKLQNVDERNERRPKNRSHCSATTLPRRRAGRRPESQRPRRRNQEATLKENARQRRGPRVHTARKSPAGAAARSRRARAAPGPACGARRGGSHQLLLVSPPPRALVRVRPALPRPRSSPRVLASALRCQPRL